MSNENPENPAKNLSIEETLEMVQNALEHTRSTRDQYMKGYYDVNRENKRLKSEVRYLESRIVDLKSGQQSDRKPPDDDCIFIA